MTTAIAAAVEEQGAATREIARNIQHAAGGTSEVSTNIVGVSSASSQAGTAAGEVLTASGALRREADVLREEIDAFLSNIRRRKHRRSGCVRRTNSDAHSPIGIGVGIPMPRHRHLLFSASAAPPRTGKPVACIEIRHGAFGRGTASTPGQRTPATIRS